MDDKDGPIVATKTTTTSHGMATTEPGCPSAILPGGFSQHDTPLTVTACSYCEEPLQSCRITKQNESLFLTCGNGKSILVFRRIFCGLSEDSILMGSCHKKVIPKDT